MKSRRPLTQEERQLWSYVTRGVRRLLPPSRVSPDATPAVVTDANDRQPAPNAQHPDPSGAPGNLRANPKPPPKPKSAPKSAPKPSPTSKPAPKPLAPLEPKTRRRLGRGRAEVAARIDLHGMSQQQAHAALIGFVVQAYASDARLVLVITGKGARAAAGQRESGVLRRLTPQWLAEPSLRHMVLGCEPATSRHGGEGAFYVSLRRKVSR